jgi:hypothetical protein
MIPSRSSDASRVRATGPPTRRITSRSRSLAGTVTSRSLAALAQSSPVTVPYSAGTIQSASGCRHTGRTGTQWAAGQPEPAESRARRQRTESLRAAAPRGFIVSKYCVSPGRGAGAAWLTPGLRLPARALRAAFKFAGPAGHESLCTPLLKTRPPHWHAALAGRAETR